MAALFLDHLARFGPDQTDSVSVDDARAYCAALARSHYENFSVVSALTPRALRPDFETIYSFCRWADDLGDEVGDPARSLELLAWWRAELERCFHGESRHPVMIALAETIARHGIPREPFEALISAFEQDQRVSRYDTYPQLLDYCKRSANPVGRLVLYVCGAYSEERIELSDFTCTGLQLANFWQDVARDFAIGRVYLPAEDMARVGVDEATIARGEATLAFRELMRFEVERSRALLLDGAPLPRQLRGRVALAIDLFNRGGNAILDAIERCGFDVLTRRPVLSKLAKGRLIAGALLNSIAPRSSFPAAIRRAP